MAERIYHPLRPRTRWLKWSLFGLVALALVEALSRLVSLLLAAGVTIEAGPVGSEGFVTPLEGFEAMLVLASAVAFAFWIYRANANLHAFGIGNIQSPGWAVGSYLIPIASLWLGYGVMQEVWNKSGPPDSALDGKGWFLPVWWSAWIFTSFLSALLSIFKDNFGPVVWAVLQFADPVATIVAGVVLVAIIGKIDVAQSQQESLEAF